MVIISTGIRRNTKCKLQIADCANEIRPQQDMAVLHVAHRVAAKVQGTCRTQSCHLRLSLPYVCTPRIEVIHLDCDICDCGKHSGRGPCSWYPEAKKNASSPARTRTKITAHKSTTVGNGTLTQSSPFLRQKMKRRGIRTRLRRVLVDPRGWLSVV